MVHSRPSHAVTVPHRHRDTGRHRVLVVYGTRPEGIKLAPVVAALRARADRFEPIVCTTAQHREMVDEVHAFFGVAPDIDLDVMTPNQDLNELTARVVSGIDGVIGDVAPDRVLVQGDTTSAMAAALAAFHRRVSVAHVEAGLRTGDLQRPFPEEANRSVIDIVADVMFAPTDRARSALLARGADRTRVFVTGNTIVDALQSVESTTADVARADQVLVTVHRRESFGAPMAEILAAVRTLATRFPDTRWVFPVHLNPHVRGPARSILADAANVELCEPLAYGDMIDHLRTSRLVLTDSGGVQEEAPTFGTPVLVLRETTERPEGIDAGVARLVGRDGTAIVASASELLTDHAAYAAMATAVNPYGDGRASERITAILAGEPVEPFAPQHLRRRTRW